MRATVFLLIASTLFQWCGGVAAFGQDTSPAQPEPFPQTTPLQYDCTKEKDPFYSYCKNVNEFLVQAATHQSGGKVDRSGGSPVWSAMKPFLDMSGVFGAGGDPTVFASLRARDIAIQNAIQGATDAAKSAISSGANQKRPDQQIGAGSGTDGTTNLVQKVGVPAILAFALESGALTRSVSGNTATLNANADGLIRAVTGQQVLCFDCKNTPVLKDIGFSASFLIDQQSSTSAATSAPANSSTPSVPTVVIPTSVGKLSSVTARYQIWNAYDPRSSSFQTAWNKAVNSAKTSIDNKAKALETDLQRLILNSPIKNDQAFQNVLLAYRQTFYDDADAHDLAKLRKDFLQLYDITVSTLSKDDPQFSQKITNVNLSLAQYRELWEQILTNAKGKPLFTFEYTFNHPQSQPETHDLRLIYGYSPSSPAISLLSVNAAVSIYGGSIPAGSKYGRLHDGQVSAEFDRSIGLGNALNQGTFSLAGYWQYQPDPSVLNITSGNLAPGTDIQLPSNAQVLLGASGSLWVTQAKFTIKAKSGINIPVAFKWANKTDLLSGNKVGAQVGISYDLSSLSSLFGGSGSNP